MGAAKGLRTHRPRRAAWAALAWALAWPPVAVQAAGPARQGGDKAVALAPPSVAAAPGAPAEEWQPSDTEKTQVSLLTQQYFRHRDRGEYAAAYAMMSPDMQQAVSLERWSIRQAQFSARAGEAKERGVRKVTWFKDPPSSPTRGGVLATVEYGGTFQNIDIHCGHLIWHRARPDGAFKLLGEEENSIDKATQALMSAAQLAAARKSIRC